MKPIQRFAHIGAIGIIASLVLFSLACASAEPTATPVAPAQPAAPVGPTAVAPAPTASAVSGAPAPALPAATPTRVLPTATPVVTKSGPKSGGTLRHAWSVSFDTLDGHLNSRFELQPVLYAVYNNIVQLNANGEIAPDLAKSWEISADGKTITFKLQEGVKFHDGTSFDANVVKWNIDRILDPKVGSAQRSVIGPTLDRVEVVDSNTVRFILKLASRSFLATFTERPGHILSPTAVDKLGKDFAIKPVGTGPYKVEPWKLGDVNTMVKNENYWEKGKPYIDRVQFQDVPDISVQLAMVRTSESDVVTYITPVAIGVAENNPSLKVFPVLGRVHGFKMVVSMPPYNNLKLRQAIGYAFNLDDLFKVYFDGRGQIAYSVIPPGSWAYSPDIKVYQFDLAKAKQLLAEAGYPNGLTLPVGCGSAATEILRCEIFQAQLAKANIKMDPKVVPQADYFNTMQKTWPGERTLAGQYFWSPRADPAQSVQRVFHSKGASNSHDYANPEVDKLIDEAETVYDTAKAKVMYDQAQKLILNDAVFIPQAFPPEYTVMSAKLKGFAQPPDLRLRIKDLWWDN